MIAARQWLRPPVEHRAAAGQEGVGRVLGAEAHFDRVPGDPDVVLRDRQVLAARDAQLQLDEIEPGDEFGHRVLDLQPGVHFHEVELAGGIEQELDRARARVADLARHRGRRQPHALAQHRIDGRRGRLLDDLLVTPLHRAVALAEVHDVARGVGEHLDLDVPRLDDGALEDQSSVAE